MDITYPLRDFMAYCIYAYENQARKARDLLAEIERVQKLCDNASPEQIDNLAAEVLPSLKALEKKDKKPKVTKESQMDEILRITTKIAYILHAEDRLPTGRELVDIKSQAKAEVDRQIEKDALRALKTKR
ncbi:MAG: hypothetical protein ABSD38_23325 [Syntrophorhabdales bacterium]